MGNFEINGKCEICGRETFYEGVGYGFNRCIFHCDKSDEAKWGNPEGEDVKRFWRAIREQISEDLFDYDQYSIFDSKSHNFDNYIFPVFEEYKSTTSPNSDKCLSDCENNFWQTGEKNYSIVHLGFLLPFSCQNAQFKYGAKFYGVTFKKYANFNNSSFDGVVKFTDLRLHSTLDMCNVRFDDAEIWITKTQFEYVFGTHTMPTTINLNGIKIGKNFDFSCRQKCREVRLANADIADKAYVSMYDVKCDKLSLNIPRNGAANIKMTGIEICAALDIEGTILDKTEFNGLNLESVERIELENTSFIGSHLTNVKWGKINEERFKIDRQMARQLKSINDAQGETVIANDFYALEMLLRSKELNWREHFGEKLVQNIHGLISNHSNDWALPTIWFFAFAFLFAALAKGGLCALPLLLLFVV